MERQLCSEVPRDGYHLSHPQHRGVREPNEASPLTLATQSLMRLQLSLGLGPARFDAHGHGRLRLSGRGRRRLQHALSMDSSCGEGRKEGDPIASEVMECLIKNDWKEVRKAGRTAHCPPR